MIKIDEDDPVGELEPSFPYKNVQIQRGVDLKEFYDLQSEIGRGKFGTVYKCREKATGRFLAAKIVPTIRKEDKRNVEREIDIMRTLQHPRLIQLYDAFEKDKTMVVVLELIEGGELFERVIGDDFVLTEKSCTAFMRQICEGMEFIHEKNILHLDMKPENILCLTKTGNRIKIIDFGLARKFDPDKKLQVLFGTPEFVAPEVVNFDQIGFGTDMWSIGVICYVLLSGLSPFMGETDIETMANVTIAKWDFEDEAFTEISEEAKDFISNLLVKEKEKRLSATQCLLHPWLRRKPFVPVRKTPSVVKVEPSPSELDLAKDNLKFFVERWNEHPNSPYIFDTSCQMISPCVSFNNIPDRRSTTPSLSGYSPSPCDSISLADVDVPESPSPVSPGKSFSVSNHPRNDDDSPFASPVNRYMDRLQIFDRRASDSSCTMKNAYDSLASRINLAEEIKKLSDKLLNIKRMNRNGDISWNNSNGEDDREEVEDDEESEECLFSCESRNEGNDFVLEETTSEVTKTFTKSDNGPEPASDTGFAISRSSFFYSTSSSNYETTRKKFESHDLTFPRRKFKFTNRDVPISVAPIFHEWENSSDTSSTLSSAGHSNLSTPDIPVDTSEHAKNILRLFEKYDGFSPKTEKARRSSLAINWSEVETFGQKTLKSISKILQASKNTEPESNSTSN